jgi:hypothetical protein
VEQPGGRVPELERQQRTLADDLRGMQSPLCEYLASAQGVAENAGMGSNKNWEDVNFKDATGWKKIESPDSEGELPSPALYKALERTRYPLVLSVLVPGFFCFGQ